MTLSVGSLPAEDLDEAARLYRDVFNEEPWDDDWTVETARRRLGEIRRTPGYRGFGAYRDGALIGVAMGYLERWYSGPHFYLKEMFVRPSRQRRGVGTTLLEALLDALDGESVERVYLLTMRDGPARAFYESYGFRLEEGMGMQVLALDG